MIIGLTGSIGSGKSTVASMLADLGAVVIDADRVGHEVYEPGQPAHGELVAAFGQGILAADGTIDRQALGRIVFADEAALARLNAIVHPRIGQTVRERIARALEEDASRPVVLEAALLLDAGWNHATDEVWVVSTRRELAVERTTRSRNVAPQEIEARLARQMPDADRRAAADVVVENDGTLDELRQTVETLWRERIAAG